MHSEAKNTGNHAKNKASAIAQIFSISGAGVVAVAGFLVNWLAPKLLEEVATKYWQRFKKTVLRNHKYIIKITKQSIIQKKLVKEKTNKKNKAIQIQINQKKKTINLTLKKDTTLSFYGVHKKIKSYLTIKQV